MGKLKKMFGLLLVMAAAFLVYGCGGSSGSSSLSATIGDVSVVGDSEITLSGSVDYDGTTFDVNLNAVIVSGSAISLDGDNVRIKIGTDSTT